MPRNGAYWEIALASAGILGASVLLVAIVAFAIPPIAWLFSRWAAWWGIV